MGRLAVILGSNALGPGGGEIAAAAAEHGAAVVQRHGDPASYVLPHEIDHAANLRPLAEQGCDRVLAVASFLTKDLHVDWRKGAWHFWDLLSDGEIANNAGNWQWVAGTGNDTRPQRVLNPVRQAERFDPDGVYVRRWVPELESVRGKAIFRPWLMEGFDALDYPAPIVDHDDAVAEFRARRES